MYLSLLQAAQGNPEMNFVDNPKYLPCHLHPDCWSSFIVYQPKEWSCSNHRTARYHKAKQAIGVLYIDRHIYVCTSKVKRELWSRGTLKRQNESSKPGNKWSYIYIALAMGRWGSKRPAWLTSSCRQEALVPFACVWNQSPECQKHNLLVLSLQNFTCGVACMIFQT
jgi:hypothetical protein